MITEYPKFTTKNVGGMELVMVTNLSPMFGSAAECGALIGKSRNHVIRIMPTLTKTHQITMVRDRRGAISYSIPEFIRAFLDVYKHTQN